MVPVPKLEEAFGIVYLQLLCITFYNLNFFNCLKKSAT